MHSQTNECVRVLQVNEIDAITFLYFRSLICHSFVTLGPNYEAALSNIHHFPNFETFYQRDQFNLMPSFELAVNFPA